MSGRTRDGVSSRMYPRDIKVLFMVSIATITTLLSQRQAIGRTWHVMNDGSGDAPTIQAGVDSAGMGDTVLVGPGTYYENVDSLGNGTVLASVLGPDATIIDGGQSGSVIQVTGVSAKILGFTIRNGLSGNGGGIATTLSTLEVRGNIIAGNRAGFAVDEGNGGGLYCYSGRLTIAGNVFKDNYAGDSGGGMYLLATSETTVLDNAFMDNGCHVGGGGLHGYADAISNNVFIGNWSDSFGGAIDGAAGRISNNTIVLNHINNAAFLQGAGLHINGSSIVENNIVVLNYGPSGDTGVGIKCASDFGTISIRCNDVWGNDVNYEVLAGCDTTGLSNISLDPQFCGSEMGDFTLRASSPCAPDNASACGLIGRFPINCPSVSALRTTWGLLKNEYRKTRGVTR